MSTNRLAIVTPVYNRAAELPALFESLSHQDHQEFTWYVVDDGSTDGSWGAIESMRKRGRVPCRGIPQDERRQAHRGKPCDASRNRTLNFYSR